MKLHLLIVAILTAFLSSGCYPSISGTVVDAETGKPIEGAVVLVEWTKTHGIGHTWTESYKVVEEVTDKEGKVKIEGCNSPSVNPPVVTVYKKGYVAWNSQSIFQGSARTDFSWGDFVSKLERFRPEYSHSKHTSFIHRAINLGLGSDKGKIAAAYYWEELEANKERDIRTQGAQ